MTDTHRGARTLILGASGQVGSAVVQRMLPAHEAGEIRLVVGGRRPEAFAHLAQRGVECVQVDLDRAEREGLPSIAHAFAGVDRMLLSTGYDVRMIAQSKAALDAGARHGVRHVVHIGVSAEPDTTIVHFGWHQLIEAYIAQLGLSYTHVWPAAFMQNLQNFSIVEPGLLQHWIGDAAPNWVDVRDVADVAAAALLNPAAHTNVGYHAAAEAASLPSIARRLASITGQTWRYVPRNPAEFLAMTTGAGADPVYMSCVRNVFERTALGTLSDPAHAIGDIERVLGRPARGLDRYLEEWATSTEQLTTEVARG